MSRWFKWSQEARNEYASSFNAFTEDADVRISELFALYFHCINPLGTFLKEFMGLVARVINLLILSWKLNGWVKGDGKVEVGSWLLIF